MVAVEKAKVKASVFASEERCPDLKETYALVGMVLMSDAGKYF